MGPNQSGTGILQWDSSCSWVLLRDQKRLSVETCVMDGQPDVHHYLLEHLYYPVFEGFTGPAILNALGTMPISGPLHPA